MYSSPLPSHSTLQWLDMIIGASALCSLLAVQLQPEKELKVHKQK